MKKLDNKNKTYLNYSTEDGKNAQDILRDKITLNKNQYVVIVKLKIMKAYIVNLVGNL